ncbi:MULTISPECIES: sirohydrochlorin chelatase [unclassified Nocardioides]|uniref:sirohydrochlorin chelatase n=1 Tax=unclassified Nocardioides TaxID=2615069 RepID=UPI0009F1033F|nr:MULTISPECIES: CbiX/SirB N-terminal domain-containing protein [unclassified Nocardioides]GAW50290.1 Putative CbiX family protein [Nocardioides sp. PD653-B2]GAW53012.1 putative CbiX family protein [Nocardioides sp. PD653]
MTRLVTVAHGTRTAAGNAVAASLTAAAGARLGLPAVASYVELCSPSFTSVMESPEPSVVVPLLLSTGHHVREDLAGARALGPDALLASAQVARLLSAGAAPGQPVVMVAAGSRDPRATRDLILAAAYLSSAWGGPVRLATLAGRGRRPAEVVRPGDAVSPYLLAPGFFATRARAGSAAAGVVADVIGPHPAVVDLIVARASELLGARRSA